MSVKFFDAPISDDELGNLSEASAAVALDAPTLTFKRQRVVTVPLPFQPAAKTPQVSAVAPVKTAVPPTPARNARTPRRAAQWLLAAAIVAGLGLMGHFVGMGARASTAHGNARSIGASPQSKAMTPAEPAAPAKEIVATPVVRIVAPKAAAEPVEARPIPRPKARERVRPEAPPAPVDTSATVVSEPAKAAPDDDLMRQAAETLSNAQLESP